MIESVVERLCRLVSCIGLNTLCGPMSIVVSWKLMWVCEYSMLYLIVGCRSLIVEKWCSSSGVVPRKIKKMSSMYLL